MVILSLEPTRRAAPNYCIMENLLTTPSQPAESGKQKTVEVPQNLWDDILDHLSNYEICRYRGWEELLERIRQHFDGPEESE